MIKKDTKTNTWYVRFYYQGKDIRKKGFKTKQEAVEFEASKRNELKGFIGSTENIEKIIDLYLQRRKTKVKLPTYEKDERMLNKYVKPSFKYTYQLNAYSISQWKNDLLKNGFKEHYINQIIKCFRSFVQFASSIAKIDNRVIDELDIVKLYEVKEEMKIWNVDEFNKFISVVDDEYYHTLFTTLFWSGLRISELKALTPNDIVNNELVISKRLESKAKIKGITTLKTASSNRRVLMPSSIIDKIKEISAEKNALIFPTSETQIRRVLDKYIILSGCSKIRIHDFRHSHASFLINSGCSIRLVSERLGHSSPSITMDYYWHLLPNEQEKVVNLINTKI